MATHPPGAYLAAMMETAMRNRDATAQFRRMMLTIALAGVLMVAGALWYLSLWGPLRLHMVIATIAGVFLSVLLGCGLFAAAFYSDKSGHDARARDATRKGRD
ncbi:hypothetical protein [Sphingomonas jatrophae]|uniref:Uncharacterized protein n=1 Tax=Sphingomonas jatrophae TaxID=1166337 RepID=A0A1I6LH77_9SPHN|nr:hypothetical protein [Sphingomonas jatrophae]SFS02809.1 hypothetical protein SAMN05192580_2735 [Sphingomonas jatrophae]